METIDKMLGIKELSEILGVSDSTVRRLLNAKQIPSYRIGGQIKVKRSDLDEYLNKQRKQ
jgi:excisionase family DNA binding protein